MKLVIPPSARKWLIIPPILVGLGFVGWLACLAPESNRRIAGQVA